MSIIGFYPIISDYWFLFLVLSLGLSLCSPQLLILMIFKLENNAKKGKHMENQKAKLQNWKNGSKINGEKKERQKGKNMEKMDLSICICFAFILLCRFAFLCFYFAFIFLFSPFFVPFILLLCFFGFCWFAFGFFLFFAFVALFFKF